MWSLKIKVREKGNIYGEKTVRHKVKVYFYSQNHYEESGKVYFVASGIIEGDEKQKKKFLTDLKNDKKVAYIEWNNDFFVCTYFEQKTSERAEAVKVAYNPRLIFLKPAIIDEEGWEDWEIASTRRQDLEVFVKYARTLQNVESQLFYLKQQKISSLMIYAMLPKLTGQQKTALILAVENGYYGYPRKITLEQLAKQMKLSVSTFQFHLAKAEGKLVPFLTKRY